MAENKEAANGNQPDPMGAFRELRDTYMDVWAKAMVDAVNSEAYAKSSGAVLDTVLTASAPFREATEKAMLQALQQLSMPSRADFVSLAERMVNVEMRLDDMDAKLDRVVELLVKPAAGAPGRPAPAGRRRRKGAR